MVIRALSSLRAPAPLARWVAEKSRGERRILAGVLMVAAVALFWAAIWQPLVRDTVALRAAQNGNAAALAAARRMTEEIAGLSRPLESAVAADARGDLERVLAQQNLSSAVTQLDWREGRARVVFAAVGYEPLIVALEALQHEAQLRVVEATLTARVEPGMVRAELTLPR